MVARTLKLNEIVYIIFEEGVQLAKGRITAIDRKQRDFHFSGDELNIDVEVEITETLCEPTDVAVGEHIHVNNQEIYQIVPDKHYLGEEVCYEFQDDSYYDFYCPVLGENISDENEFDENQTEDNGNYENGYEYVQAQIESGRWDLESDTFDIETALADAWEEGFAQARNQYE